MTENKKQRFEIKTSLIGPANRPVIQVLQDMMNGGFIVFDLVNMSTETSIDLPGANQMAFKRYGHALSCLDRVEQWLASQELSDELTNKECSNE